MEAVENAGEWWLPETPDVKVSGVLRVDEKGKSQLTLIGALGNHLHDAECHDRPDGSVEFRFAQGSLPRSGRYPESSGPCRHQGVHPRGRPADSPQHEPPSANPGPVPEPARRKEELPARLSR